MLVKNHRNFSICLPKKHWFRSIRATRSESANRISWRTVPGCRILPYWRTNPLVERFQIRWLNDHSASKWHMLPLDSSGWEFNDFASEKGVTNTLDSLHMFALFTIRLVDPSQPFLSTHPCYFRHNDWSIGILELF